MTRVSKRITRYISLLLMVVLVIGNISFSFANEKEDMQSKMDAYYNKGTLIQYYNEGENCKAVLDVNSEEVQVTCCSDFVHDFYLNEYDLEIEHSTKAFTKSKYLYRTILNAEWQNLVSDNTWYDEINKNLQVGDLINVVKEDTQQGHIMMVYDITDSDVILIHSTGSKTKEEAFTSEITPDFIEGSIRKQTLNKVFSGRYLSGNWDLQLIRPLQPEVVVEEQDEETTQNEETTNNEQSTETTSVEQPVETTPNEETAVEKPVKEKSEMQKLYDKYYEKGVLLQYVNKGETYFSTIDLNYPEAQNTQCAHFTNSFYTNEFGIKLANSVTKINGLEQTNVIKTILYDDWKKLVESGEWKKELLSDLQEGDIITVRHPDLSQSIGHAMMVYEVLEDDAILIHSTGSNSKTDSFESEIEKGFTEGSIRKQYLSTVFENNYVNAERDVRVARPLAVKIEELPEEVTHVEKPAKGIDGQTFGEYQETKELVSLAIMTDPHLPYASIDGSEEHTKINNEGKKVYNNTYDGTNTEKFITTVNNAISRGANAVLVPGDFVWSGAHEEEWQLWIDTLSNLDIDVIESMGNHEIASNNVKTRDKTREYWREYTGTGVYYDTWIGDTHIISLGMDSNEKTISGYSVGGSISKEQIDWVTKLVEEDNKNNVTSIILAHLPIDGTYPANYYKESYGYYNEGVDKALYNLVANNDNAILFSGHTHAGVKVNGELRIHQTENGGMFVHAGIIHSSRPVYVMMEEVETNNNTKEYKLSYVYWDSDTPIGTFTFKHSEEEMTPTRGAKSNPDETDLTVGLVIINVTPETSFELWCTTDDNFKHQILTGESSYRIDNLPAAQTYAVKMLTPPDGYKVDSRVAYIRITDRFGDGTGGPPYGFSIVGDENDRPNIRMGKVNDKSAYITYILEKYEPKITSTVAKINDSVENVILINNEEGIMTDIITLTELEEGKTYQLLSFIYKDGEQFADSGIIDVTSENTEVEVTFNKKVTEAGTYTIKTELSLDREVIAVHNADLNEESETVVVTKEYIPPAISLFDLKIHKIDKDTEEPLEGAEFIVYQIDFDGNERIEGTLVTDENGEATITITSSGGYVNTETGEVGVNYYKYFIKETKTLEGYDLDETIYEIDFSTWDKDTLVITNSKSNEEVEKSEEPEDNQDQEPEKENQEEETTEETSNDTELAKEETQEKPTNEVKEETKQEEQQKQEKTNNTQPEKQKSAEVSSQNLTKQENSSQPKTGDTTQIELYFILLLLNITVLMKIKIKKGN